MVYAGYSGSEKGQPDGWPDSLNSLVGARGFELPAACILCAAVNGWEPHAR
jgi:hypothetical protein